MSEKEIFTNSATLIVLGASLCAGLAYTFVRALSVKGEKGPIIVLVFIPRKFFAVDYRKFF